MKNFLKIFSGISLLACAQIAASPWNQYKDNNQPNGTPENVQQDNSADYRSNQYDQNSISYDDWNRRDYYSGSNDWDHHHSEAESEGKYYSTYYSGYDYPYGAYYGDDNYYYHGNHYPSYYGPGYDGAPHYTSGWYQGGYPRYYQDNRNYYQQGGSRGNDNYYQQYAPGDMRTQQNYDQGKGYGRTLQGDTASQPGAPMTKTQTSMPSGYRPNAGTQAAPGFSNPSNPSAAQPGFSPSSGTSESNGLQGYEDKGWRSLKDNKNRNWNSKNSDHSLAQSDDNPKASKSGAMNGTASKNPLKADQNVNTDDDDVDDNEDDYGEDKDDEDDMIVKQS